MALERGGCHKEELSGHEGIIERVVRARDRDAEALCGLREGEPLTVVTVLVAVHRYDKFAHIDAAAHPAGAAPKIFSRNAASTPAHHVTPYRPSMAAPSRSRTSSSDGAPARSTGRSMWMVIDSAEGTTSRVHELVHR